MIYNHTNNTLLTITDIQGIPIPKMHLTEEKKKHMNVKTVQAKKENKTTAWEHIHISIRAGQSTT